MSRISIENDNRIHPLPSSIIIVNEATPLLSQEQYQVGSHAEDITLSSCLSLSPDEQVRVKELKGLFLLILSSFLFAWVSVIVKWLGDDNYSFVQIVLGRACIQLPLGGIGCCIVGVNPFDATGLFYRKDNVRKTTFNPRFLFYEMQEHDYYGRSFAISCSVAAALMSAMAYITMRKVGQQHVMVHVVYLGLVSTFLGVIAFLGQYFINVGLKLAPIGLVIPLRSTDVVFAFLFGIIIFHELPGFYTLLGTLVIVTMTGAVSLHQWHRQELRHAAIKRRKLKDKLMKRQQNQQQNEASASTT
ncbi:hypothetical protein [Parasitella parasitica]|uniref:EamA domain-containing protein n=1 Tax=Parasitella parasitica TaxID=35722 RepID=A0A0B7MY15_9FUNG|nr:hypothetical protein [Parasitella parasitica]